MQSNNQPVVTGMLPPRLSHSAVVAAAVQQLLLVQQAMVAEKDFTCNSNNQPAAMATRNAMVSAIARQQSQQKI